MMKARWILPLLAGLLFLAGCAAGEQAIEAPEATPSPTPTEAPFTGAAEGWPLALSWGESVYEGEYSGELVDGVPQGRGRFSGENAVGQALSWDGGWQAGVPAGDGVLRADRLVTAFEGAEYAGAYEGGAESAVPQGKGSFRSLNAEGVPFVYEGQWSAGLAEGEGILSYDAENYYQRVGAFTAGRYTPDFVETLVSLGTGEPAFALTREQMDFISGFPSLWEAESHQNFLSSEYAQYYNRLLTLPDCFYNPETLETPQWISIYSLRALTSETVTLSEGGPTLTYITAANVNHDLVVRLIVPEELESLRRGQSFHVYAIPLCLSEYTTVLGQKQSCAVLLVGDIYLGP